jgi:acyl-ACP thioesterase
VHSFEVDPFHRLGIVNLFHYFQESAWNHANHLGLGFSDLADKGKMWVLVKLGIQIDRLPQWNEKLELMTWPRGKRSLFALRDFEVFNYVKSKIIKGSSEWVIIDTKSRRPRRIDGFIDKIPVLPMKHCFDENINTIDHIESEDYCYKYQVCYSDLDFNGHVNNAKYIQWALNTYSSEFHGENMPFNIEVNYRQEAEEAQNLEIRRKNSTPDCHIFSIRKENNQQDLCRILIRWKEKAKF